MITIEKKEKKRKSLKILVRGRKFNHFRPTSFLPIRYLNIANKVYLENHDCRHQHCTVGWTMRIWTQPHPTSRENPPRFPRWRSNLICQRHINLLKSNRSIKLLITIFNDSVIRDAHARSSHNLRIYHGWSLNWKFCCTPSFPKRQSLI